MKITFSPKSISTLSIVSAILITACSSVPPRNASLEGARESVAAARADAGVALAAPREMQRAETSLDRAEKAWRERQDETEVAHYAYLGRTYAAVAVETAKQRRAEQEIATASSMRDQALLAARSREAANASREAAIARGEAANARVEAVQARSDAQMQAERASQLQQQLSELSVQNTQRGLVVTLQDVLFDTAQATLKPGAQRSIDRLAAALRQAPERKVMIEGFTDSQGSDSYNLQLSERRANAVRAALVAQGIAPDRIMTRPYGEAFPVASNDTAEGRQQNRRVEIIFSDENGQIPAR